MSLVQVASRKKNKNSKHLATAFLKTMINRLSRDERAAIQEIEVHRSVLDNSRQSIHITAGYNVPDEAYGQLREVLTSVGSVSSTSSIQAQWAVVLFRLIRECKPVKCFEMGTNIGISAAYQASALHLNKQGELVTLEMSPAKIDVATGLFKSLGLSNVQTVCGRFQDTLEAQLEAHRPIDYVFIDGHHDGVATLAYFNTIAPRLADGAILVFDDIRWSEGMNRAWRELKKDSRLGLAIDFYRIGICIFDAST